MTDIPADEFPEYVHETEEKLSSSALQGVLEKMVVELRRGFYENFMNAVASDGEPWPARDEIGDGHPLMIDPSDDYDLCGSLAFGDFGGIEDYEEREVEVGVMADESGHPGAAALNWGNRAGTIPPREYLYASEDTIERMADVLAKEAYSIFFG